MACRAAAISEKSPGGQARRNEDDPGVLRIGSDRLRREDEEIRDVAGDHGAPFLGGMRKLSAIVYSRSPRFVGAHGIDAARTEDFCDPRREILIEVDLHPAWTVLTRPGQSFSTASGVRARLASTWPRTSSG